jgi:hypothetical protein
MSYRERAEVEGPKKLLAIDGGGIRGVLALEFLGEIEAQLRSRHPDAESFVLADYFDYIAGTSTGAIIAAGLACRMSVDDLRRLYDDHGKLMFDRAFIARWYKQRYNSEGLEGKLREIFGDITLGDARVHTLLMMVLRNATTDSPWPLSNNPGAKYNAPDLADNNLSLPLWQLVRASTAAPLYFPAERIRIGDRDFVFVDGGLTVYNNPSFQLFLMATLPAYGLAWPTGEDRLLLVSVGTGTVPKARERLQPDDMNVLFNATSVPAALMSAALHEQDLLCRVFGRCRHGAVLDHEIGDLIGDEGGLAGPRRFSYARYNAELTSSGLDALGLADIRAEDVQKLDSVDHIRDLQRIGRRAAREVRIDHFAGFL